MVRPRTSEQPRAWTPEQVDDLAAQTTGVPRQPKVSNPLDHHKGEAMSDDNFNPRAPRAALVGFLKRRGGKP
jgi:hypothetical protein